MGGGGGAGFILTHYPSAIRTVLIVWLGVRSAGGHAVSGHLGRPAARYSPWRVGPPLACGSTYVELAGVSVGQSGRGCSSVPPARRGCVSDTCPVSGEGGGGAGYILTHYPSAIRTVFFFFWWFYTPNMPGTAATLLRAAARANCPLAPTSWEGIAGGCAVLLAGP